MHFPLLLTLSLPFLVASTPAVAARGGDVTVKQGQSIQKAINNAKPNTRIVVQKGTYREQLLITKNGITLVGKEATLLPPSTLTNNTCTDLAGPGTNAGICITGKDVVPGPYPGSEHRDVLSISRPTRDITITGFTIANFALNIATLGTDTTTLRSNTLLNASSYGILSHFSTSTLVKSNTITTPVLSFIGICTDDNGPSRVASNSVAGYGIGLCVQTNGAVYEDNKVVDACAGAFIDPGISARVVGNDIGPNNPDCLTAFGFVTGILIFGANGTTVARNKVRDQRAGGQAAGIGLVDATQFGVVARDNLVRGNVLTGNDVDIFVGSQGEGNVVRNNRCTTPAEFCGQ
ncbi:pectin lyase fold/virulence factor [Elsinoe ampelina]|uniref:Pectin lyase fold/virulence factor n=1 Tax=Elsinoe ampelina TaxID=302913 RepID=A0A6A6GFD5_9PEZI|nr:pectin lyase fold/virulence factor [Elsinoe ampelina]